MAQSDANENKEVSFHDLQKDLKTLSKKELRALVDVLIDDYYSIVNEKVTLTTESDQSEEARSATNHIEDLETGELVRIQPVPGEGLDSQDKSCNRANEHGGSDSKSNGQQLDAHANSPRNDSQKDQVCMHGEKPGSKDINKVLTHQKFNAPREISRNQVPQIGQRS
ncbi:hypothetical protein HAX54_022103 [Datura stramonium]|uniref:Uncharacterized protein n=1 Tax=Datura stramonium TaxID=4076 RepID=A0ABS8UW35_DATST|nr:hypothetical protein [Datura stramonium]